MLLRERRFDHRGRVGCFNQMRGVARLARYTVEVMFGPVKLYLILARVMTRETSRRVFGWV